MAKVFDWTGERVEQLRALVYDEQRSYSAIARIMGCETRNVPLCKTNRLRASGVFPPSATTGRTNLRTNYESASKTRERRAAAKAEPPPTEEPALVLEGGGHVTLMTVSDRVCRWPIGDPRDEAFHFCGHRPGGQGIPYCPAHMLRAYQPARPRAVPHRARYG